MAKPQPQPTPTAAKPPAAEKPNGSGGNKPPTSALALMKRNVVDVVATKIGDLIAHGGLFLPANYSAENALKAAWLAIQEVEDRNHNKALAVCTPDSIANSLLDMVVQGLNPARRQCYFIVYGKRLICQRSYFGALSLLKRIYGPQVQAWPSVVYEGDEFEYTIDRGRKTVTRHVQKLANVDETKIVAAYVIFDFGEAREPYSHVMTIDQIRRAWQQGPTKGGSPAHQGFTSKMAMKTAINSGSTILINDSDDAHLVRAVQRQSVAATAAAVEAEALEAGDEPLDLDDYDESAVGEPAALPAGAAVSGEAIDAPAAGAPPPVADAEPVADNATRDASEDNGTQGRMPGW